MINDLRHIEKCVIKGYLASMNGEEIDILRFNNVRTLIILIREQSILIP